MRLGFDLRVEQEAGQLSDMVARVAALQLVGEIFCLMRRKGLRLTLRLARGRFVAEVALSHRLRAIAGTACLHADRHPPPRRRCLDGPLDWSWSL
ncbi:hypothetical protein [Ornithinimicrobium kibberense]|uniref:hypothetical protein n=1 Tax=Ornithinimicrobium kibberense TaxID=282060 RepID=UPI00361FA7FA